MGKPAGSIGEPNLDLMKEAIRRYYEHKGFEVSFPDQNIPTGNAAIDGEIKVNPDFKIAVEFKGPEDDDVVKGLGQLVEALIDGYQQAILVVTAKRGRTVRRKSFRKLNIGLATVDPRGNIKFLEEAKNSKL